MREKTGQPQEGSVQLRGRSCYHVKREVIKGRTGPAGSEQRLEGGEEVGQTNIWEEQSWWREQLEQMLGGGRCLVVLEEKQRGQCDCSRRAEGGDRFKEDQGQMGRNGAHHKDFYLSVMGSPCGF